MKNRSFLRDVIIKVLYQIYIYDSAKMTFNIEDLIKEQLEEKNEFVYNSLKEIIKNQETIDNLSNKYLKDWTVDRLSKVDRAILSLGIYELLYTDTPNIVCINEAIELAKMYSDEKVVKMINATLDSIYRNEVKDE